MLAPVHLMKRSYLFRGFVMAALLPLGFARALEPALPLRTNDVVAFLGGANVVAAQESGHLETLLTMTHPGQGLRFRTFAWEGDTVFAQPRELNFPLLTQQLSQAGATLVFVQFGQMESLSGPSNRGRFAEAYGRLLDRVTSVVPRVVLVTPPPFEPSPRPDGPDASARNAELASYAAAIRDLAAVRGLPVVDLFTPLVTPSGGTRRLTWDGVQLTPLGQEAVARQFAAALGRPAPVVAMDRDGRFTRPELEAVRQAVVRKNRLWFDYSRPMNWAFLGGDRTDQPSSRDHRDRSIRWFPKELEQFIPLIAEQEQQIAELAAKASVEPTR